MASNDVDRRRCPALVDDGAGSKHVRTESKRNAESYFSPKQLASCVVAINADDKQADIFLEAYLQKLDPQGQISPGDLVQVFKESGIDKDEAVKMSEVLLSPQKQPSSRGYDFRFLRSQFRHRLATAIFPL